MEKFIQKNELKIRWKQQHSQFYGFLWGNWTQLIWVRVTAQNVSMWTSQHLRYILHLHGSGYNYVGIVLFRTKWNWIFYHFRRSFALEVALTTILPKLVQNYFFNIIDPVVFAWLDSGGMLIKMHFRNRWNPCERYHRCSPFMFHNLGHPGHL